MIDSVAVLILCSILFADAVTQHCHEGTGRCYWISDTAQGTRSEGRTARQSEGGDLAVMETEELFDFVVTTFRFAIKTNNNNNSNNNNKTNNNLFYFCLSVYMC